LMSACHQRGAVSGTSVIGKGVKIMIRKFCYEPTPPLSGSKSEPPPHTVVTIAVDASHQMVCVSRNKGREEGRGGRGRRVEGEEGGGGGGKCIEGVRLWQTANTPRNSSVDCKSHHDRNKAAGRTMFSLKCSPSLDPLTGQTVSQSVSQRRSHFIVSMEGITRGTQKPPPAALPMPSGNPGRPSNNVSTVPA
jgi:hypothetical protein